MIALSGYINCCMYICYYLPPHLPPHNKPLLHYSGPCSRGQDVCIYVIRHCRRTGQGWVWMACGATVLVCWHFLSPLWTISSCTLPVNGSVWQTPHHSVVHKALGIWLCNTITQYYRRFITSERVNIAYYSKQSFSLECNVNSLTRNKASIILLCYCELSASSKVTLLQTMCSSVSIANWMSKRLYQ